MNPHVDEHVIDTEDAPDQIFLHNLIEHTEEVRLAKHSPLKAWDYLLLFRQVFLADRINVGCSDQLLVNVPVVGILVPDRLTIVIRGLDRSTMCQH